MRLRSCDDPAPARLSRPCDVVGRAPLEPSDFYALLADRSAQVFDTHPELVDHRTKFPWLFGALGNPRTPVWFVAENPSLRQVQKFAGANSPEVQWTASNGDKLLREALTLHGFKTGGPLEPGGWRCYITDVIKSAGIVAEWRQRPEADRMRVAEAWASVLEFEVAYGGPKHLVVFGKAADAVLAHLERRRLIPSLPPRTRIHHYSYLGQRAEGRRGPGHPERVVEWHRHFAEIASRFGLLDEG